MFKISFISMVVVFCLLFSSCLTTKESGDSSTPQQQEEVSLDNMSENTSTAAEETEIPLEPELPPPPPPVPNLSLKAGKTPTAIRVGQNFTTNFTATLATLNNIDEEALKQEGAKGDDLRRRIIAQDLMNRGYSEDKIKREVKKSFDAGTDIEDAIEALQANV